MAAIDIELGWADGAIGALAIRSERPEPSRALRGLAPAAAIGVLARLYAVCGHAQQACAELALAAAGGPALAPQRRAELGRAVAAEAAQEHLWRLLLDWPRKLGLAPQLAEFKHWYARIGSQEAGWPAALLATLELDWLGAAPGRLREFGSLSAFDAWCAARQTPFARLFDQLRTEPAAAPAAAAATTLAEESECGLAAYAEHAWLAALCGAGRWLEAHVAARLVGLVAVATALAAGDDGVLEMDAESPGPGRGVAVVATARGMLEHDVTLADGRVGDYAIRTPTDCNFGAHGPYVARLRDWQAPSAAAALRIADLWALAFDPCVSYAVGPPGGAGA